jgi:predicted ArsR family transcriptional regulator
MFLQGFRDLVRPQWVTIIEELKIHGGMAIPELARIMEMSYMGVKQHCEALHELGYVERQRVPRGEVGRPEILYRLTPKAGALFPQAGVSLTLTLLQQMKHLFGGNTPEKLLLLYFTDLQEKWQSRMQRAKSLVEKATLLASLREKEGCFARCTYDVKQGFRMEEYHHPLWALYEEYPAAVSMEVRMMEQLMGCKVERREVAGGRGGPAKVVYAMATL